MHAWQCSNTIDCMKTLTVRLPEVLVAEIEAESRGRKLSKSDVVRQRLTANAGGGSGLRVQLDAVADLLQVLVALGRRPPDDPDHFCMTPPGRWSERMRSLRRPVLLPSRRAI